MDEMTVKIEIFARIPGSWRYHRSLLRYYSSIVYVPSERGVRVKCDCGVAHHVASIKVVAIKNYPFWNGLGLVYLSRPRPRVYREVF